MKPMSKKLVKLAMLRKSPEDLCPFGLPITLGCQKVGDLIQQMMPLESIDKAKFPEEYQQALENNQYLFRWHAVGVRCPFANKIFKGVDHTQTVDCTWSQPNEGVRSSPIVGSNYYAKAFSGIGVDGLYSIPLGYYQDAALDRGTYFGPYAVDSITSNVIKSDIEKQG